MEQNAAENEEANKEELSKDLQQQVQEQVRDVTESPQAVARTSSPALKEEESGEDTGAKVWIVQEEGQQQQEQVSDRALSR